MYNKMKIILIVTMLTAIIMVGCEDYPRDDFNVYVENTSDNDVYACCGYFYPDTTFQRYIYKAEIISNCKAVVLQYNRVFILRPENRQDTLSIFLISSNTMSKYAWDYISNAYDILCRYDLSGSDILNLNYTIPYPPSPTMKDMKMYPSYEDITNKEEHP